MNALLDRLVTAIHHDLGHAPETITPGTICRFPTSPRRTDDAGWCYWFEDGKGAVFGDYRTGQTGQWSAIDRRLMTPGEQAAWAAQIAKAKAERDKTQRARWSVNHDRNRDMWRAAHELVPGDVATQYLKRRGLTGVWPLAACLRYTPSLSYFHGGEKLGSFPAMLAQFRGTDGRCLAIHRTYLNRDGRKADHLPSPKKLTGASGVLAGGCIPLGQPRDGALGVAEGIETALCAGAGSGLPVVATYSAGCLAAYQWPQGLKRLVIFADNDASGTGQKAADKLQARARAAGLSVLVMMPSTPGTDWADVYTRRDLATVDAVADSLELARFGEGGQA